MLFFLIALVGLCVFLWLKMKWNKVKKYWSEKNVPFEEPHPMAGNLTFLQRENPALWMRRLYKKFKSPYVGVWLFWRPALVINSPDIARRILVKDADVFRNRYLSSGNSDPIGALNIFTANDPLWTFVRRRLTAVFTASKLRSMQDLVIRKADDLVERLKKETENDDPIHIRRIFTDFTTDIIGESAFGVPSEATKTGDSIIRRITREFGAFNLHRGLSWSSIFFWPELVDIFRFSFFPKESTEFLKKLFRNIVAQRGGYEKEVKEPRDLFDALLKLKYEAAKDDEEISEDILLAQAAVFLLGGFDTTGSTFTLTVYELAYNPDIQERLYNELFEAKQQLNDRNFDSNTLAEMPYLNAVIKETLRLFPPMGWLDRIADKDYKIDENLTIPAGTPVYVNGVGMQVDPEYFEDPESYNPDRFLPENEKNMVPYTYIPFGDGPRKCIGMRFGLQVLRFGLTKILLNYKILPLPKTPRPNEVQIEKNGMFMMPGEKLSVKFVPRISNMST